MRFLRAERLSKIGRVLFLTDAGAWIMFGMASLTRLGNWSGTSFYVMLGAVVLMFGNAVVLFWFGWMVGGNPPHYLRLALFYVFLNLVLSITDQFGLFDFLYLVYCLILFALCLRLYVLTNRRTT